MSPARRQPTSARARRPQAACKMFKSTFATWDALFEKACAFATQVGPDRLISISHSEDANEGVVTVWYWKAR